MFFPLNNFVKTFKDHRFCDSGAPNTHKSENKICHCCGSRFCTQTKWWCYVWADVMFGLSPSLFFSFPCRCQRCTSAWQHWNRHTKQSSCTGWHLYIKNTHEALWAPKIQQCCTFLQDCVEGGCVRCNRRVNSISYISNSVFCSHQRCSCSSFTL